MNASKEEARKANKSLWEAAKLVDECEAGLRDSIKRYLLLAEQFIDAAERKLPTEAALGKLKVKK